MGVFFIENVFQEPAVCFLIISFFHETHYILKLPLYPLPQIYKNYPYLQEYHTQYHKICPTFQIFTYITKIINYKYHKT